MLSPNLIYPDGMVLDLGMNSSMLVIVFLCYGLAFFSMGLVILVEIRWTTDLRLRQALKYLASFGLLHGIHEWLDMIELLGVLPGQASMQILWSALRLILLAVSFLLLAAFGSSLLAPNQRSREWSLLIPIGLATFWGLILLAFLRPSYGDEILVVADVWSRYVLAIPGALLACGGLIVLRRAFRRVGMHEFGQDSLWAAIAFLFYGPIGQIFTRPSTLPPSTMINQDLFFAHVGVPVQVFRAGAAVAVAWYVIRLLRSFEAETQQRINVLQSARILEVEQREKMRQEYLQRVVNAQENERKRIARELHDETGQSLTAIGMGMRGVSANLRIDLDRASQQLCHLEGMVDHSLGELQRIIADLHPSHLDDLGLPAALRWYTEEMETRMGKHVNLNMIGVDRPIPSPVKIALFRIAQEALGNSAKHSSASQVLLDLNVGEEIVELTIEDDGVGFDQVRVTASDRPTWGLRGMEERARLLDGELKVSSAPDLGTRVHAIIPLKEGLEMNDEDNTALAG